MTTNDYTIITRQSGTFCAAMRSPDGRVAFVEIVPNLAVKVKGVDCTLPKLYINLYGKTWTQRDVEVAHRNERLLKYGDAARGFIHLGCDVVRILNPSAVRLEATEVRQLFVDMFQPKIAGYDFSQARRWV